MFGEGKFVCVGSYEGKIFKDFGFIIIKFVIYVVNVGEDDLIGDNEYV